MIPCGGNDVSLKELSKSQSVFLRNILHIALGKRCFFLPLTLSLTFATLESPLSSAITETVAITTTRNNITICFIFTQNSY